MALDAEKEDAYIYFEADHETLLVAKLNEEFTNLQGEPSIVYDVQKAPLMGSADTSKARYVWLPFTGEEDFPKLHWRENWSI